MLLFCVAGCCSYLCLGSKSPLILSGLKQPSQPWLVRLSGLSSGRGTKGSLVQFSIRAHAWVVGQVCNWGHVRSQHGTLVDVIGVFLPVFLPPSPLSENK